MNMVTLSQEQVTGLYVLLQSREEDLDYIQAGVLEMLRAHLYQSMSIAEFENIFDHYYQSMKGHA